MGSVFSHPVEEKIAEREDTIRLLKTCDLDECCYAEKASATIKYAFDNKLYLCPCYPAKQKLIIINIYTGQYKFVNYTHLPTDIVRPRVHQIKSLLYGPDGHEIFGIVEIYTEPQKSFWESTPGQSVYIYTVALNGNECRILEKVTQFRKNGIFNKLPDLTNQSRFLYSQQLPDSFQYTLYEFCFEHEQPAMKTLATFNYAKFLGGWTTNKNFAIAFPEQDGLLYVRELISGRSNVLKIPVSNEFHISSECVKSYGDSARVCLHAHKYDPPFCEQRIITIDVDTNQIDVIMNIKLDCQVGSYPEFAVLDNSIFIFNDPTAKNLMLQRLPLGKPESLSILAFLASKEHVMNGQVALPANFPIKLDV